MSQSQHSQVISPQSKPPVSSVTGDANLPATTVLQSTTVFMKLMRTYSGTLICYYLAAGILFCSGPLFCGYVSVSLFIWNEPMIYHYCRSSCSRNESCWVLLGQMTLIHDMHRWAVEIGSEKKCPSIL